MVRRLLPMWRLYEFAWLGEVESEKRRPAGTATAALGDVADRAVVFAVFGFRH